MIRNLYFLKTISICLFTSLLFYKVQAQNTAISMDGIDDRLTVHQHAAYNRGTGDFTVEAIINVKATTNVGAATPVFSSRTRGTDGFVVYAYSTGILLQMNGVPNYVVNYSDQAYNYYDGLCHHVAVTRSGTSVKFYLDGTFQGTVTAAASKSINSTGNLYIGFDSVDTKTLNGSVSEARFWSVERTATEINTYKNANVSTTATGLIGLWKFAETSGQTIIDSSPTANNGVLGITSGVEDADPIRSVDCGFPPVVTSVFHAEEENKNIAVVPNPFDVQTKITLQTAPADYSIEVYSTDGSLVYRTALYNSNEFVLGEELKTGMYAVKIISASSIQTTRVLKK